MGGGKLKEVLLIVLPFAEDRSVTDKIRERFPHIEVKYHQLTRLNWSLEADQGLPEGCSFHSLLSFSSLPSLRSLRSFQSSCARFISSLRISDHKMRGFSVWLGR
jgi:hypothetical protein